MVLEFGIQARGLSFRLIAMNSTLCVLFVSEE